MSGLNKKQKVLLFLFLGIIFIYSFNQLKESDSFYHVKTGEVIWETKTVPTADPFSYLSGGAKWVTHEWLAELIFYGAWRAGGFWLLMALVAFLGALTYYVLFKTARDMGGNFYLSLLLLFALGGLTFELWIPRPQIFSYFFFALSVFLLERYRATGERKYLLWLAPIFWAWANMHASIILGLGIVGIYILGEMLSGCKRIFPEGGVNLKKVKELSLGLAGFAAVSLFSPNGYSVLLYSFTIKDTAAILGIAEWKSILSYFYETETKVFLAEMALVTAVLIWRLGVRRESRSASQLLVVLSCAALPFVSIRHVAFWSLASFPFFAGVVSAWGKKYSEKISEEILWKTVFVAGLIFIAARYGTFPRSYYNPSTVPVPAADFVEKSGLKGPLFNLYNEGGYLIWRFYPREKVSMDGRSEVYDRESIRDYFSIVRSGGDWDELVNEKYKINYFFLAYRPELLSKSIALLISNLFKNNWPLIYWDDNIVIFVRPSEANKELISRAYWHISPFRDTASISEGEGRAVAEELKRLFETTENTSVAREWAERFLSSGK